MSLIFISRVAVLNYINRKEMRNLKRIVAILTVVMSMMVTAVSARIPDHRGTSLDSFPFGTRKISSRVTAYNDIFKQAGDQYGIDPNILAAICMQESGGINYSHYNDGTSRPAWGIMQIEYTNEKNFAAFGKDRTGVAWTLEDRLDPSKAVPYAAYLLSEALYKYDCDYAKMLQSYNFGEGVLNRIIAAKGDDWVSERANAKKYVNNWPYEKYGDPLYIEHVLSYYYNNIDYVGTKVRLNGSLVKFSDQYPVINEGTTLIPVRAISEMLGANVEWNGQEGHVHIDKNGKKIDLYIGQTVSYINEEPFGIDIPPEVVNNRTLVPLRFVAEALDVTVNWNGDTRTVELTN